MTTHASSARHALSLRSAHPLSTFEQAVDQLEMYAPAPAVVQRVLALLLDGQASWVEIESTLAVDGGLVARVLRLASTPAFAARQISNLRFAVQALGTDQLRRVVVTAQFAGRGSPFTRTLWAYSLRIACVCDALARHAGASPVADPFLCGLLHDVGTMALETFFGTSYTVAGFAPGDPSQIEIERETFGFDHCDLGAMIAARWRLFPELEMVAQLHHDPEAAEGLGLLRSTRAAIDLVALARAVMDPTFDELDDDDGSLCDRLDLDPGKALACGSEGARQADELLTSLD